MPDLDLTHLEFVTIDPAGSMDLDQAMHLEADGDGYVVHYAIADVRAFVAPGRPGGRRVAPRGESLYGADSKIPLHPTVLSEGAASLLPGEDRPAFVWTIALDADGDVTAAKVERARVRSREKLDYVGVQRQMGQAPPGSTLALLETVGKLRIAQGGRARRRLPADAGAGDRPRRGGYRLEYREMLPVETWNAQLSLLTGFAAAALMIDGQGRASCGRCRRRPSTRCGRCVVRRGRWGSTGRPRWDTPSSSGRSTRPVPPTRRWSWPARGCCGERGTSPSTSRCPPGPEHAALASPYAHVTAPLRRLVDRYGLEICAALCAGAEIPAWVLDGMDVLPDLMRDSGRRSHAYENAVVNLVEALTLRSRVGERFEGVVLEVQHDDEREGTVMVRDPAVEAPVVSTAPLPVGEDVTVQLTEADPATRKVRFTRG